jgi:hypothetical protein
VDRSAVQAQRDLVLALRSKVATLVASGKTLDEVLAAKPTAEYDAQVPQAGQSTERLIRWLYSEVAAQH